MTQTDAYLVKLKGLGISDATIGGKLGMTEAEVRARWVQIQESFIAAQKNGYADLCAAFGLMAHQYQQVGESLKLIGGALGRVMTTEEIQALVVEDPRTTLTNLQTKCILLHPYTVPTVEEQLKRDVLGN